MFLGWPKNIGYVPRPSTYVPRFLAEEHLSIFCSGSKRGLASLSPPVSLCGWKWHKIVVKGNDSGGCSSDDMVLLLGKRQNRDVVEWCREWLRLR
jgi:hypothetical protein